MVRTQRRRVPEKMDHPDVNPDELQRALRFLQRVNRFLGGSRATIRHLDEWFRDRTPGDEPLRVLDIATGSGDIPVAIVHWARKRGIPIKVIAIDSHRITLEVARKQTAAHPEIEIVEMDARELLGRFAPSSFHVTHTALFLHHLDDGDVVLVLRAMNTLASRGIIWSDLIRSPVTKVGVWPVAMISPPIVRHDAIVSMDAGFTRNEALALAREAGVEAPHWRSHLLHRFTLTHQAFGASATAPEK